jgi:MFS family permease
MRTTGKYKVLLMIWLLQFVNYLDRINLSIAAPTMMREMKLNPNAFGFVLAAFTFGYAIGARCMLIASPILWSIFTGMTGFASTLIALVAVRVLFGASEGLSNGASFKLIGDHFASHERSAANAAYLSALALGPAFIAPVAVWFLTHTGWQGMFRWLSLPGLAMALLIWWVIPKQSRLPTGLDQACERSFVNRHRGSYLSPISHSTSRFGLTSAGCRVICQSHAISI